MGKMIEKIIAFLDRELKLTEVRNDLIELRKFVDRNIKYEDDFRGDFRKILCKNNIHNWSDTSCFCCGNVKEISQMNDKDKYNMTKCWWCGKEDVSKRDYFNRK